MSSMVISQGMARQRPASRQVRTGVSSLRLTARGRWVLVLALLAVIGLAMILRAPGAVADAPSQGQQVRSYVVQPGDTLWALASEIAAPGDDVRDVVAELADLNGLGQVALTAGQEIILPVVG